MLKPFNHNHLKLICDILIRRTGSRLPSSLAKWFGEYGVLRYFNNELSVQGCPADYSNVRIEQQEIAS